MAAERKKRGAMPGLVAGAVVLLGLDLLLAGEISRNELLAGIPAALAVAGFATARRLVEVRSMHVRAPWPHLLLQSTAALATDSARVGAVLIRAIARRPDLAVGAASTQPFREGGDDPADAGRRALVTLASSLAPNGYVLGIGRDSLILHRLAPTSPDPDREWPL